MFAAISRLSNSGLRPQVNKSIIYRRKCSFSDHKNTDCDFTGLKIFGFGFMICGVFYMVSEFNKPKEENITCDKLKQDHTSSSSSSSSSSSYSSSSSSSSCYDDDDVADEDGEYKRDRIE